jgi:hypothetical protein
MHIHLSKDVVSLGKKNSAGRSTTSSRACNPAQAIKSCLNMQSFQLTTAARNINKQKSLAASPYYKYHCIHCWFGCV